MGMIHRHKKLFESAKPIQEEVFPTETNFVGEAVPEEKKEYTEEEINKLPYFSLKSAAADMGIDTTDKSAKQIRKELIKKIKEERS